MARHPPSLAGIAAALLVLTLLFGIIERIAPAIRGLSIWRWHRRIDFLFLGQLLHPLRPSQRDRARPA